MDADHAALLVRSTARVSAVILSTDMLIAARRLGAGHDARRWHSLRAEDVEAFIVFLIAQTIHFGCVLLLAMATDGKNIRDAGGWAPVIAAAVLFYVGAGAVLRVKRRRPPRWITNGARTTEVMLSVIVWLVFFQAFALRAMQWWFFAALATFMAASLVVYLTRAS
jgi:hypothetical protein